jgi:transposase
MQQALLQMHLQLSQARSDVTGATGQRLIRAIVAGERAPQPLAALRHYRCKKDAHESAMAWTGTWRAEPLFVHTQALALFDCSTPRSRGLTAPTVFVP